MLTQIRDFEVAAVLGRDRHMSPMGLWCQYVEGREPEDAYSEVRWAAIRLVQGLKSAQTWNDECISPERLAARFEGPVCIGWCPAYFVPDNRAYWAAESNPPIEAAILAHTLPAVYRMTETPAVLIYDALGHSRLVEYPRDEKFEASMLCAVRAFIASVNERRPPMVTRPADWSDILRAYPIEERVVELNGMVVTGVQELVEIQKESSRLSGFVKELNGQASEIKARIIQYMGGANVGLLPDGTVVRYSMQKRKGYTTKDAEWPQLKITGETK